ncbi:MAG: MFS transporter [Thermoanaerobaculia bacterium]
MSAPRPLEALRFRDFRALWAGQIVSLTGTQMQSVAIHWHVYLLTGSPLALGLVGLTRAVPIVLFSLLGGVVADRRDRRVVMGAAQAAMTLAALLLAGLTFTGRDSLAAIYVVTALSASASAFDGPARQALLPRLVPLSHLSGAVSLNLAMFHAAMISGPALAGLLIARLAPGAAHGARGLGWIYLGNALSFGAVLLALATMRTSGKVEAPPEGHAAPLEALREGLRFVFTTPVMVWTMALDFFATFFSGALSLLPIVADRVLGVGGHGYGWLMTAPAVGALAGALLTSVARLPRRQGVVLLASVAAYGGLTVVYGLSRSFWLTFAALALSGLADSISTVIRQLVRQLATPDALRGRMTSVNMIFFMGGPQLGELEAGFVASLFASAAVGVTVSIASGGLATVLAAAAVAALSPAVRGYLAPGAGSAPPGS